MTKLFTRTWGDVAYCDICDNYTEQVYVEEFNEKCCEGCYLEYGECN